MGKTISKETCKAYNISKKFASISYAHFTADTLAYIVLTGNVERPQQTATNKSYWIEQLMNSKAITWHCQQSGSARSTFIFREHGIVIKVERERTDRDNLNDSNGDLQYFSQSEVENRIFNNADRALRQLLNPVLSCFVGKHGREDVQTIGDKHTRVGKYCITVMPLCDTDWMKRFDIEEFKYLRSKLYSNGIRDVHIGNVAVLNDRLVSIDYGIA